MSELVNASPSPSPVRQAEFVMALALATDIATGHSMEYAMCTALLGVRLGEAMGLSDQLLREIYYVALLCHVGCVADTETSLELFGDDPGSIGETYNLLNPANPRQLFGWVMRTIAVGDPALVRLRKLAQMPLKMTQHTISQCEIAELLAQRLGLEPAIQESLWQAFECWNGSGSPHHRKGEALTIPIRVVHLARTAETYRRVRGEAAAVTAVREQAGSYLDPQIAVVFLNKSASLLTGLEDEGNWQTLLQIEPGARHYLTEQEFDEAALTVADFIDLVAPFFACHSRRVAELAAVAAQHYGLPEVAVKAVERMGWLHDLGKIGVPPGIWYKPRPLSSSEWERVRLHPYFTERIFAPSEGLSRLAACAALHHERLDGSGYHRGLRGNVQPPEAHILAAANAYQAMLEARPFRERRTPDAAADQLRHEVRGGKLDSDAVKAVLNAAGHRTTPVRRERLAGLSEREIEVLRLVARGLSKRQIAEQLQVSENTVGTHIMHIYDKINVSTRSGATLYAMQHHLLTDVN